MPRVMFLLASLLIAFAAKADEPPLLSVFLETQVLEADFRVLSHWAEDDVWAVGSSAVDPLDDGWRGDVARPPEVAWNAVARAARGATARRPAHRHRGTSG